MNVYDLLATAAARQGDRTALVFGPRHISYRVLLAEADELAAGLRALGLGPGDRVLVHAQNRPEVLVTYFAAGKLGCILVPANPSLQPDELRYMLDHARPDLVMTEPAEAPRLAEAMAAGAWRPPLLVDLAGEGGLPAGLPATHSYADLLSTGAPVPPTAPGGDESALIVYTSGSTGRPKGVLASHTNEIISARSYADVWQITPEDRVVVALPVSFLYGLTTASVTALGAGATVVMLPRFHPGATLEALTAGTVYHGVPTMFSMMLNYAEEHNLHYDLSRLRLCLSAGAPLHDEVRHRFAERFGIEIMDFYALSEIRPVFAYDYARFRTRRPGSCGHRLPGVEVQIVDADGRPVPRGEVGELLARSATLMKAYFRDPEQTAKAIRDGWFHTGDLAREDDDGFYHIVGRKKELIIRGGINVSPAEVENVLLQHPAIAEAAVVGAPDPVFGEVPWAFIRWRSGAGCDPEAVRSFCRQRLAEYKVPAVIRAVDELPKGPTGKVLRSALAARAAEEVGR